MARRAILLPRSGFVCRCCLIGVRSEEHTSELQSQSNLVCRLLLEKKKKRGSSGRLDPPERGDGEPEARAHDDGPTSAIRNRWLTHVHHINDHDPLCQHSTYLPPQL